MHFKISPVLVFIVFSLFPGTSLAQNKVVVIPLTEKAPTADLYPAVTESHLIPDLDILQVWIHVPETAGIIKKLEVFLYIDHSFNADLDVTLKHPSGEEIELFTDIGWWGGGLWIHLDDEAETDIGTAPPEIVTGSYNPEGTVSLSAFNGLDASGWWYILITDDSAGDTGSYLASGLYIVD